MRTLRGLRAQILLWTILPLILILTGVSFGSITLHQQSMRTLVAERDTRLAGVAASWLDDSLHQRALVLQTLLARADEEASPEQALANAGPLLTDFDLGISLLDRQGRIIAQRPSTPSGNSSLPAEEHAVMSILTAAVQQPGSPVFAAVPAQEGPRTVLVALTRPGLEWVAVGGISGEALNLPGLLSQLQTGPRAIAYLVDRQGRVIYHPHSAQVGQDFHDQPAIVQVQTGRAGAMFVHPPGRTDEHVIGYAPVALAGWGLVVEEPWTDAIVPALQYTLLAPLVVLVAAVISLAAIYFGLRRVIQPLQVLGHRASRLAWGDFLAIRAPVGGIGEIEDLQRTLQEMAEQIRRYQAGMQDYIATLTQAQEEERLRLARELHDDTIQSLIALTQRVKLVELALNESATLRQSEEIVPVRARVSELSAMVAQTLHDMRQLIHDLRPIYLEELGLVPALDTLVRATQRDGLASTFEVAGEERRLPPGAELAVYRIAQEGLSNAVRHAHASEVDVQLNFDAEGITLAIEDNGAGFVPPERPGDLTAHGHFGLMGMYERTTRLGGHLSIRSMPGQGAKVVAFLPSE